MPHMSVASGKKEIENSGIPAREVTEESRIIALQKKVSSVIKLLQKSEKLCSFFTKLFARQEMKYPIPESSTYLNTLLDELLETLSETPSDKLDDTVLQVFLRYNFNHESVIKYYFAMTRDMHLKTTNKEIDGLEDILRSCEVLGRKDMAYNKATHSLRKEINHLATARLKEISSFEPFKLLLNANVFFPLIRLLKDAKVFEEMKPAKERNSLRYAFRDDKGLQFSINTITNRSKMDHQANLDELKKLIDRMNENLDEYIKVRGRNSASKKHP